MKSRCVPLAIIVGMLFSCACLVHGVLGINQHSVRLLSRAEMANDIYGGLCNKKVTVKFCDGTECDALEAGSCSGECNGCSGNSLYDEISGGSTADPYNPQQTTDCGFVVSGDCTVANEICTCDMVNQFPNNPCQTYEYSFHPCGA